MMKKMLLIAAGGAAGSICRYYAAGLAQRLAGTGFPTGTFAVNMVGCLLFGAVWGFFENRIGLGGDLRLLVLTGFLGAFTTFSTFMFESAQLVKASQVAMAALNIGGQAAVGLLLVFGGMTLGRLL